MTACESVRGEWGGICPDCGQRLPSKPRALSSWKATRPSRSEATWDGRIPDQPARLGRRRGPAGVTDHQRRVIAALKRHDGDALLAAAELGISAAAVRSTAAYARRQS